MNLLFIISGSIAVKKCKKILEQLSNQKIYINCIITNSAKNLFNINSIKKIIKGKVFLDSSEKNNKMLHIKLTRKSDLIVVCPATANLIAKFSHGFADDLASTALIASNKQILFIPAMNVEMWDNKINKKNVKILQQSGVEFIGPEYGYLSCGEIGLGRLANDNRIIKIILNYLEKTQKLKGISCLVTAGPTIEPIDAVRYLSNYSSGKQGYEIAKQLMLNGAKVTLVSGPTNISNPPNINLIKINSAKEMNIAVKKNINKDVAIFTAAVTDIKPLNFNKIKIKKDNLNKIILKKNPDIIKNVSKNSFKRPKYIIGFALETSNHINNAKKKLFEKNCDVIVVNKITKNNKAFDSEYNKVDLITKNKIKKLRRMTKIDIAKILVKKIIQKFDDNKL